MIEYGKYRAEGKLEQLRIFWNTGKVALPENARLDAYGRENIPRWQSAALFGGRQALRDYIGLVCERERRSGNLSRLDAEVAQVIATDSALPAALATYVETCSKGGTEVWSGSGAHISSEIISTLVNIFEKGMLSSLTFTQDIGEIPTPEILTRSAGPFPLERLIGKVSALCVFTVRQLGIHDVIHVYNAGIGNVTLVDSDDEWMKKMKKIYPPHWSYMAPFDYRVFVDKALREGQRFDVVITDPPLSLADEVVGKYFAKFMDLCIQTLIMLYTRDRVVELGFDGSGGLDNMSRCLSARHSVELEVTEVMRRVPNVYWVVITKR